MLRGWAEVPHTLDSACPGDAGISLFAHGSWSCVSAHAVARKPGRMRGSLHSSKEEPGCWDERKEAQPPWAEPLGTREAAPSCRTLSVPSRWPRCPAWKPAATPQGGLTSLSPLPSVLLGLLFPASTASGRKATAPVPLPELVTPLMTPRHRLTGLLRSIVEFHLEEVAGVPDAPAGRRVIGDPEWPQVGVVDTVPPLDIDGRLPGAPRRGDLACPAGMP